MVPTGSQGQVINYKFIVRKTQDIFSIIHIICIVHVSLFIL